MLAVPQVQDVAVGFLAQGRAGHLHSCPRHSQGKGPLQRVGVSVWIAPPVVVTSKATSGISPLAPPVVLMVGGDEEA